MTTKVSGPSVEGRRAAQQMWANWEFPTETEKRATTKLRLWEARELDAEIVKFAEAYADESHREIRAERDELRECLRELVKFVDADVLVSRDMGTGWIMQSKLPELTTVLARAFRLLGDKQRVQEVSK